MRMTVGLDVELRSGDVPRLGDGGEGHAVHSGDGEWWECEGGGYQEIFSSQLQAE